MNNIDLFKSTHTFGEKIFITGIYGSGKTTYAQRLIQQHPKYTFLSYDNLWGYHFDNVEKMEEADARIVTALETQEFCVMDALPLYFPYKEEYDRHMTALPHPPVFIGGDWSYLEKLNATYNCTFVLVTCDRSHWINKRIPLKVPDILQRIEKGEWDGVDPLRDTRLLYYDQFYEVHAPALLTKFASKTIVWNSNSYDYTEEDHALVQNFGGVKTKYRFIESL